MPKNTETTYETKVYKTETVTPAREFPSDASGQVLYLLAQMRDDFANGRGDGKSAETAHRLDLILQVADGRLVTSEKGGKPTDKLGVDVVTGKDIYAVPDEHVLIGHNPDGTPIHVKPSAAEQKARKAAAAASETRRADSE